jgi:hypothetical protein
MKRRILKFGLALICATVVSCTQRLVTEPEAKDAALKRIESVKGIFKFDPTRLPPLSGNVTADGYVYEVRDFRQKVWIVVHVSKSGLAEVTALPLDNAGNAIPPAK